MKKFSHKLGSFLKVSVVALGAATILVACSAASTLHDLHIDGLKNVEFGETKQEVITSLGSYQLTPAPDIEGCTAYSCDGLTASYDAIKFSPSFLFGKKGNLKAMTGIIINSEPQVMTNLQIYLTDKFGKAEVKDTSRLWSDGGVTIVLSSTGQTTGVFNFIEFRSPDFNNNN